MGLSADDIIKIMKAAKDMGMLDDKPSEPKVGMTEEEIKKAFIPKTPFDEMSEEEILYYATPHYDEIQRIKEEKKQRIQDEVK